MAKTNPARKTRSNKFPLTLHPTGQYCKKIRGKSHYFGRDRQQVLQRYLEQASHLHVIGAQKSSTVYDGILSKALCNIYLEHQRSRAEAGEIGSAQISAQTTVLREFARYLGPNCSVSDISTMDLQNYRSQLIKQGKSAARINNQISAFKAMFHRAADNEVIEKIPNLKAMGRFHNYSPGNAILIGFQKPDATHVAGFRTWQKLGRYVKKAEHGIATMAPIVWRRKMRYVDAEEDKRRRRLRLRMCSISARQMANRPKDKTVREAEAEAVDFVVCHGIELDTTCASSDVLADNGLQSYKAQSRENGTVLGLHLYCAPTSSDGGADRIVLP